MATVRLHPRRFDPTTSVLALPGGSGRVAEVARVRRGVGFAVGFKNLMYSAGFDDYSTARVRLEDGVATVTCAAAEAPQYAPVLSVRKFAFDRAGRWQI